MPTAADREDGTGHEPIGSDSGTPSVTEEVPNGNLQVSCVESPDNVLRWTCAATVDPPAPVSITLQKTDGTGPVRDFRSELPAATHAITLSWMAAQTGYTWHAIAEGLAGVEATGTFETRRLPDGVDVDFTIEGQASFPYTLSGTPCPNNRGAAVIASTDGEVLWYHQFGDGFLDALSFTEDGTILAVVGGGIREIDRMGRELLTLERGVDFPYGLHHDVFRKDGLTWALRKDPVTWEGQDYILDGLYVFDASGALRADWRLVDHFQPTSPPGAFGADYSHANSVWVGDAGDVYVSFRHLSAIARIDGDLASPTFGAITWRLAGNPADPDFGSDFAITAPVGVSPTFEQQHNAHLLPDGTLALFDNRIALEEVSRVLHLSLDPVHGEATITQTYPLPLHCDFQGGAWHTVGGNPVATCAPPAIAYEFDRDTPDTPRWTMDMDCGFGGSTYVPRFIPLEAGDL